MEDSAIESITRDVGDIDFHHPFTPYDVQLEFMKTAYDVLQKGDGQVGILESPTGTGKSLSLICACLTWLRTFKRSRFDASLDDMAERLKDKPSWVVEHMLVRKREELAGRWKEREERLRKVREKEKLEEQRAAKRRRIDNSDRGSSAGKRKKGDEEEEEEDEFLLDWGGADDGAGDWGADGLSKETRELMAKVGLGASKRDAEEDDSVEEEIKIFFTSRTHSQLTQFISELRRPNFPPSYPQEQSAEGVDDDEKKHERVKHVPLSSRQKLCINPAVARLGSASAINDRCAELQKPKKKSSTSDAETTKACPFVLTDENLAETHQFRDAALATVPDIEDAHRLGKELGVCPYYATRKAIPGAEIVTLPYPLLLQKSAREALGIRLEGSVVVIDEAHNIMDAVAGVHAAEIRLGELRRAREMLAVYARRFGKKLKGENRVLVGQVARVVQGLSEWLERTLEAKTEQGIVDPDSLLRSKGIDQINLFSLISYIQDSKLAFKIESYAAHVDEQQQEAEAKAQTAASRKQHPTAQKQQPPKRPPSSTPVLHTLTSFLLALTNLSTEGRIFFERIPASTTPAGALGVPDIKLSYILLSPTHAFSSIASAARAVILAGGTMAPFRDYETHLFPTHPSSKITTLSCGHVIPPENLCVWTLASSRPTARGAGGGDLFEFSFQRRRDKDMIARLGAAVLNICAVVPDGVVVFFPSYGYLDEVVAAWREKPTGPGAASSSVWDRLTVRKAVFRESKGGSSDDVLQEYSRAILGDDDGNGGVVKKTTTPSHGGGGALLLSVVGGKMSEGINFSDRLGRCVVVVGLPYPNIASPEWKARMEYVESSTVARLTAAAAPSAEATKTGPMEETEAETDTGEATAAAAAPPTTPPLPREQALAAGKQAARDFYENACMRAVNQSIGRAIRHRGDYAAIVLLDRRFGTDRIRGKLPGWIRGGMVAGSEEKGLQGLMGALNGFFRGKRVVGAVGGSSV